MEVPDCVGHREGRLQIQVKDGMAQRGQIDQGNIAVSRLQSQGEVDGDGGGATSSLGVHHGKDFASRPIALDLALVRG